MFHFFLFLMLELGRVARSSGWFVRQIVQDGRLDSLQTGPMDEGKLLFMYL